MGGGGFLSVDLIQCQIVDFGLTAWAGTGESADILRQKARNSAARFGVPVGLALSWQNASTDSRYLARDNRPVKSQRDKEAALKSALRR